MESSSSTIRRGVAMRMWTVLLAAVLLVSGAAGQDESSTPGFVYPPAGSSLIFNKMDTVMVTYTGGSESAILWTFCEPGVARVIYRQKAPATGSVPVLLNFTSGTPCWFNVRFDGKESGPNSSWFNVIGVERSSGRETWGPDNSPDTSSTSSSTSSTSSTSSISSTSSTASATPSATGTETTDNDPNNTDAPNSISGGSESSEEDTKSGGLSAGASAGIGIGVAVAVIALAGVAFWLWRRRGQRQGTARFGGDGMIGGGSGREPAEMGQYGYRDDGDVSAQKWVNRGELGPSSATTELSGGRMHHEMAG